jgi:hypothetical protein
MCPLCDQTGGSGAVFAWLYKKNFIILWISLKFELLTILWIFAWSCILQNITGFFLSSLGTFLAFFEFY